MRRIRPEKAEAQVHGQSALRADKARQKDGGAGKHAVALQGADTAGRDELPARNTILQAVT